MRKIYIYVFLLIACDILAQTKYQELLVRDQRTYWANTVSLCNPTFDNKQDGMCFYSNGLYDRYEITEDNDTLSYYDLFDTELFVSSRTYKLENDTIFITSWHTETGNGKILEAYKILYLTDHRLVLLELKPNGKDGWEEVSLPGGCDNLKIREYKLVKP